MTISAKSLQDFVDTAKAGGPKNYIEKGKWLHSGRRIARVLAEHLKLGPDDFDIYSQPTAPGYPGISVLHTDTLYVVFFIGIDPEVGFVYRTCEGRENLPNGSKQYLGWDHLLDLEAVALKLQQFVRGD